MKKVISFMLIFMMVLCVCFSTLPAMAASPEGSAVRNAADLAAMSSDGSYYLSNDITISSSYASAFKGTLDGNGHKIKIADGANVSPFKKLEGATVKNLTVEGVINIRSKTSYGGIAEEGYGRFENVTSKVGISAMVEDFFNSVGASQGCFIAKATGECEFINCKNQASVTVITQTESSVTQATVGFGGFIGTAMASGGSISFTDCVNDAAITSLEPCINVAGFVGASVDTALNFTSCENNAIIVGASSNSQHCGVGGFVGTATGSSINVKDCHNNANVQSNGNLGHGGGFAGRLSNVANFNVDRFSNSGSVSNTADHWEALGGVVGIMGDTVNVSSGNYIFKDCINSGEIIGSMAGGLVGIDSGLNGIAVRFERCINVGTVKAIGAAYAGGIMGRTDANLRGLVFTKCFNSGTVTTDDGGYGVGGIMGNIGKDNVTYTYTPMFEYCVNTGSIACKTTISTAGNVVAAGILARNIYMPVVIRGCINVGVLSNSCNSSNIAPIAPKYNVTHDVTGCSYLSAAGGSSTFGESAKAFNDIREDVASALTNGLSTEASYYNYRNSDSDINSVGEGVDVILAATAAPQISNGAIQILSNIGLLITLSQKKAELIEELGAPIENIGERYTADSFAAYKTAFDKIKSDISAANNAAAIDAINVAELRSAAEAKLASSVDNKKAELLALLGEKKANSDGVYTSGSYDAYAKSYQAIKDIIDNATDLSVLNVLDVTTLKDAAEAKLVLKGTQAPDAPITDNDGAGTESNKPDNDGKATETEAPDTEGKKCGSSIALSALAVACVIGAAFAVKKKD